MNDLQPLFSFIGALTLGGCVFVGASVLLRGAWAAAMFTWGRRDSIDSVVEDELKIRIGGR
jgi:hypothetical protein